MTKQGDFKAMVRERVAKTGESYSVARRHILNSRSATSAPVARPEARDSGARVFVGELFPEEREGQTLLVPSDSAEFGPYTRLRRVPDEKVAAILAKGGWRAVTADELSYSMEIEFSSFEDYGNEHEFFS